MTDDNGFYLEQGRTYGRLLEDTSPLEAPESPVAESSPKETRKASTGSVLERIAFCESRDNPLARNPHSTASGLFQIVHGSWVSYGKQLWGDDLSKKDIFDGQTNTELAKYMYEKEGVAPWESSRRCWQ